MPDPRPDQVTLPAAGLAEALRQVVRAASNDDARPLLTGVLVAAEGRGPDWWPPTRTGWPCGTSTGTGPLPEGTDQILVPARALTELQRLLPAAGRRRPRARKEPTAPPPWASR